MKRIILLALVFIGWGALQAQTFRIGPTVAGEVDMSKDMKTQMGFAIGVRGELMFNSCNKGWFADVSVLFGNHRTKSKDYFSAIDNTTKNWKYSNYVLSIPINVGYKFSVSNNLNILAAVGPYVDFGLTGSSKAFAYSAGSAVDEKKASSNVYKDNLFNRVNLGVNAKVGFEISNHYQINISYNRGLTNVMKNRDKVKMQNVQLGFAYMF